MYIKIPKGTKLFEQLSALSDVMTEYNKKALNWAKDQGATSIRIGFWNMAGGISSAIFKTKPTTKGWIKAGPKYNEDEYRPGKAPAGKELRKAIEGLPKITFDDFNAIVNYDPDKTEGIKRSLHPGISHFDDYILMNFADHTEYTPVSDMIEITVTEYRALNKKESAGF